MAGDASSWVFYLEEILIRGGMRFASRIRVTHSGHCGSTGMIYSGESKFVVKQPASACHCVSDIYED